MTQINSNLRPELDLLLNDENKFPELYNRYQMLKNNRYLDNTFINIVNTNCCNETKICTNFIEEEKVEPGNINESNENINTLFVKRSNSMKCINQNSSSEKNIFKY